ncbi:MAG: ABC transporter ATP-binding protein [Cyclobacteriaceae bacterium]
MKSKRQSVLIKAYVLLNPYYQNKGLGIIFLMVFQSILDFFSLASFLPLIFLIVNPEFITSNHYLKNLYSYLGSPSQASFIIILTLGVLLFTVFKNLISVWIAKVKAQYAFGIGRDLAYRALSHFMEMSYLHFSQVDYTRELNRMANLPMAFANNIILPVANLISELFVSIFILTAIAFYDYKILILLFIILLPALLLYRIRRKDLKEINSDLKEKYPLLLKYGLQVIEGLLEIKVYGKESFFGERFRKINRALTRIFVKDQILQSGTVRLTEVIVAIVICALIIYSVLTQQHYEQTLLLLGIYTGASFRVIPSVNRILRASQQIKMHEYLFDEFKPLSNFYSYYQKNPSSALTFRESIELKNISFAYLNGPPILQEASLKIAKGEKIAITGKSGAGKTTVFLILLRFLKETSGKIRMDDKPIENENAWRKLFGYVPQDPFILDGTFAENIAFGVSLGDIDQSKILKLIAELELNELVRQWPDGIDTRIGERGAQLSGGQRQRLAIARALYAGAEILLLDEITNQLHASIELEILNLLDRLADQKKTIIMITHKPPRIDFFNSIYNLEKGKLHATVAQS